MGIILLKLLIMDSTFFIQTEKKNTYIVNIAKKSINLIHPYMADIYFRKQIDDAIFSLEDQKYLNKKIRYFAKHGIISKETVRESKFEYLSSDQIEENLANLKQVVFETTEKCNLKCKYCYYGEFYNISPDRKEYRNLPDKIAQNILNYLSEKQSGVNNISMKNPLHISFYGGEALLNVDLISTIIRSANKNKFNLRKLRYSLTTNGTLLKRHINLLVKNNVHITVSLDGNKVNNSYRIFHNNKNSFDIIFSNLMYIKENFPTYFEKNVDFNAVLHNRNSVKEIYNFFTTTFNKTPSIVEMNNSGIPKDKVADFSKLYISKTEDLNKLTENKSQIEHDLTRHLPSFNSALIFIFQYLNFVYRSYNDLLANEKREKKISTGTCSPFSRRMFITTDGKILPCEKISQEHVLGQINDFEIDIDPNKIAKKYNFYYEKLSKQCQICYRQYACTQCMFFLRDIKKDVKCSAFMNKIDFVKYLYENLSFMEKYPSEYLRIMKGALVS